MYTRMIFYSLQHFKALQLYIRETYYCNNHNVNVNTFCKCKHDTFFRRNEERKNYPAEHLGG